MDETYTPDPLNTDGIALPEPLEELVERLAANNHDIWAARRIFEGWRYGDRRNDVERTHPDLVPYDKLKDSEKEYDRDSVRSTLIAIVALGYRITKI